MSAAAHTVTPEKLERLAGSNASICGTCVPTTFGIALYLPTRGSTEKENKSDGDQRCPLQHDAAVRICQSKRPGSLLSTFVPPRSPACMRSGERFLVGVSQWRAKGFGDKARGARAKDEGLESLAPERGKPCGGGGITESEGCKKGMGVGRQAGGATTRQQQGRAQVRRQSGGRMRQIGPQPAVRHQPSHLPKLVAMLLQMATSGSRGARM